MYVCIIYYYIIDVRYESNSLFRLSYEFDLRTDLRRNVFGNRGQYLKLKKNINRKISNQINHTEKKGNNINYTENSIMQ